MAVFAVAIASASAANTLTLYANGQPVPAGESPGANPFKLESTSPVQITVPSKGISISCPPVYEKRALLGGYLKVNSRTFDKLRILDQGGFYETYRCGGVNIAGPGMLGVLELRANGSGALIGSRHGIGLVVDACIFWAKRLRVGATIGGPLAVSFAGTLTSEEAGCGNATIETGWFQASFESQPVEGLVE
jgi:hypothetical protein